MKDVIEALSWALDLLDMYDEKLVAMGEPREKVYSEIHLSGKQKARAALQHELNLHSELCAWLDSRRITSENIGDYRRACFMPWDSRWNAIVRDETAAREKPISGKEMRYEQE